MAFHGCNIIETNLNTFPTVEILFIFFKIAMLKQDIKQIIFFFFSLFFSWPPSGHFSQRFFVNQKKKGVALLEIAKTCPF